MANEITLTAGLTASKTSGAIASGTLTKQQTMTGDDMVAGTQLIPTSDEALILGDITGAPGALMIKNLDTANFVELSLATGANFDASRFLILRAGAICLFQPQSATIYAQADTAAVRVQVWAVEV